MVDIRGISVFLAVADYGGFSAAARHLNQTRSAVGKTIAKLEQRLRVRLFHRTTRSHVLTEEGQNYYDRCLRAISELKAAELELESGRTEVRGRLRVSMPVLFGRNCVAPILFSLLETHPRLELDLSFNDRVVDLLEDGFDLAIRMGSITGHSDMMSRVIAHQTMAVCAAPAYLKERGHPSRWDDISLHDGIIYGRHDRSRTWLFPSQEDPYRQILPISRLRLDDLASISDAAVRGLGLAWLPCWLIRDQIAAGTLVRLFPDTPAVRFPVYAAWLKSPAILPKIRAAIDALVDRLPAVMR